jgi:hypothetical protein
MNRPKGLALTAWLMVALSTLGWSVIDWNRYRNPNLHNPRAAFVFFITIIVTMKICGLVCIWYYYQGRNWARIVVLLTSLWTIYCLRLLSHGNTVYRSLISSEALLGLFFLYWLNTPELRKFFQSAQPNIK